MDATMKKMLERLVIDFNNYSELVALNYEHMKEKNVVKKFFNGTGENWIVLNNICRNLQVCCT